MSNESIRIRTTPNDGIKTINVELNQKFDFIEILSLKISQEDAYRRFCSDYGVVVGRVTVNTGFGVPNAKVSIFIPITDEDKEDPVISGLYPYSATEDRNSQGLMYNLLPKTNETSDDCFTETGSFFNKREFQDNDEALDIYCKYYKYTTVSNAAGDYMFFGIPNGSYLIHVDADISNIGVASQKPYDLIREGDNKNKFYSSSKFKRSENLTTLTQIKTRNGSVNVIPFWGDTEQCGIGITRFDVDLATNINPSAIFIGSIFGDNKKNSVNKRCRPRRSMGSLENMTTGSGTIEMIRRTILGEIERFDIDGGELIDDNGTWAYQVPMNLDYVTTDEFGNLIPTDDPNKGIPTRARVRFRVGMNATGGEGRVRTRAKYLVPHNPTSWTDSDYNFDENTKDKHFQDFHWNKIYSISNHITRVQSTVSNGATNHRTFTALKEVDDGGNNNLFPFNKIDITLNPLFVILCIIVKIIAIIVKLINQFIIPAVNGVFYFLNKFILKPICKLLNKIVNIICALKHPLSSSRENSCKADKQITDCEINYISYVVLSCSADETGKPYCIGCDKTKTGNGHKESFKKTTADNPSGFYYPGSNMYNKWEETKPKGDAGWVNCIALALADALGIFKFDFFNDWINGTLYAYLLKYKVRRKGKGKEKFCEIDCGSTDGVDNNKDGQPDNDCFTNYIVDTCTSAVPQGTDTGSDKVGESNEYFEVKEGLIKKYKGELYYAAFSKKSNYKLYSTKIVCLGAVFECDWQGLPKLHQYLVDSSYNRPPLINVYHDSGQYTGDVMESGFDSPDSKLSNSQICNVDCTKLGVGSQQCNNIKRLCEITVNSDEDNRDDGGPKADFKITNSDVSNAFVRGMFAYVNGTFDPAFSNKIQLIPFDANTEYKYDHKYYDKFRGVNKSQKIWSYDNSFYFYFGLLPGKTAITRLKTEYFPTCIRTERKDMAIVVKDIQDDSTDGRGIGSITIAVNGGVGPYRYEWEGPIVNGQRIGCCYDGATKAPCNSSTLNCVENQPFSNLYGGTYTVTVTDSNGLVATTTVTVGGFIGVECEVQPRPTNSAGNGNVYITLSNGTAPYNVTIQKLDANDIPIPSALYTLPSLYSTPIGGHCYGACNGQPLPEGNYILVTKDSGAAIKTECNSRFSIIKPETLTIDVIHSSTPEAATPSIIPKLFCNGNNDGTAEVTIEGGTPPYTFEYKLLSTPNPLWYSLLNTVISTSSSPSNLVAGTYKLTVTDLGGNIQPKTFTILEPPAINVNLYKRYNPSAPLLDNGYITLKVFGANPPFIVDVDGPESFTKTVSNSGDLVEFIGLTTGAGLTPPFASQYKPYKITVTDVSGCTTTTFTDVDGQVKNEFKLGQTESIPLTRFQDYVGKDYSDWVNGYDKVPGDGAHQFYTARWGITPPYQTSDYATTVYRTGIGISGRFYNSTDSYHVRFFNGTIDSNKLRVWWGNARAGQRIPYYGGWHKIDSSNSHDDSWARALWVYVSENVNGTWTPKIQSIPVEISDNNQKDTFNVSKCFIHNDLDNGSFDGDYSLSYGNIDGTSGLYAYVNTSNNGRLIGESGNTILLSPNSPFTDVTV
jgi:hypothetical protein